MPGFGRIHQPDPRDHQYLLEPLATTRTSRFWRANTIHLDQGQTPRCTAYAWMHFYCDSPKPHSKPYEVCVMFYNAEQKIDGMPMPHDGSSVRAGAKVLKADGHCTSYRWAFTLHGVVNCLLEQGPVIVGTNWYDSMFQVGPDGFVKITAGASIAGGHAYKLDGVNTVKKYVRIKNSWGTSWGQGGFAKLSFAALERLIGEDGEACKAVE